MKYLKRFNESHSKSIKLNDDEVNLFNSEPLLQKLITDKKISLFNNEVKYDESDIQTKEILDQYLELPGKIEEKIRDFQKIKNYKLFLESLSDNDEFKKQVKNLKSTLYFLLKPIFYAEKILRVNKNIKELESTADSLIELLFDMFISSVNTNEDVDDEFKDLLLNKFEISLKSSRPIFIELSYEEGIDQSIKSFIEFLEVIKKDKDSEEEEEWKKSKEVDYEDMSKSEINDLIDQALDARDFDKVKFLSQYLKEGKNGPAYRRPEGYDDASDSYTDRKSFEITDDMKAGIQNFCDTLVSFIVKNYYVL